MTNPHDERGAQGETTGPASLSNAESCVPSTEADVGCRDAPSVNADIGQTQFAPRPWGLAAVVAAMLASLAGLGLGLVSLRLAVGEENVESALVFNVSLAIIVLLMLTSAWIFGPAIHGGGVRSLGLRPSQASRIESLLLPSAVLAVVLVFNVIYVAGVNQLGLDVLEPPELPFNNYSSLALAVTGFMVVLAGPFAEEVFFRGFVLSGLIRRWRPAAGLMVSAAIFSIAHASVALLIPIFVAGALLGWLYLRTGSLWSCVWVHGAQNAVAFTAALTL